MSVQLPNAEYNFVPQLPPASRLQGEELHSYLQSLRREMERMYQAMFDNDNAIVTAINSGTSFTATSTVVGIVVTNGIVTSVST